MTGQKHRYKNFSVNECHWLPKQGGKGAQTVEKRLVGVPPTPL